MSSHLTDNTILSETFRSLLDEHFKIGHGFEEKFRQTGRTQRAIKEVHRLSLNDEVYFVVPSPLVRHFQNKFNFNKRVRVIGDTNSSINWENLSIRGLKNPVIFDHSVLYRRYKHFIEEYLRFFDIDIDFE